MKNTKIYISLLSFFVLANTVFAQGITTAGDYFKEISDYYSTIKDYEADIEINFSSSDMKGRVSFKRPELLRIDFQEPADQVILFNGDDLTIYIPGSSAILRQTVETASSLSPTAGGLNLMRRYYSIAYETGQEPVHLDDSSDELVVNFMLYARASSEAFSTIRLSVDVNTKLIRRVIATTKQNEKITFDIYNYSLNTNMANERFIYEPPSSANEYNNFLFSD